MQAMTKDARADRNRLMLSLLQEEESNGGFNEFPQFCEDLVIDLLEKGFISENGLVFITREIEKASMLGITCRAAKMIEKRGFSHE